MNGSNSYVTIDLDAIRENLAAVRQRAGAPVMAVVKANAYGHGAVPVACALEEDCAFFGVASVAEALQLRRGGITKPILILGPVCPQNFPLVVANDIRPTIFRYPDALALSQEAQKQGKTAPFHFAVDTGMSRVGMQATEESADLCVKIAALPGLVAEGLFSHFATADEKDLTKTYRQAERFAAFDGMLKSRGLEIPVRHLENSAGTMHFGCTYDMVRAGIVLYGLYPSDEVDPSLLKLKPAMSWHSNVSHVKTLEPGREIGYGGTFRVEKTMRVATVPVGYADGYRRSVGNRFYVLIRGKKAPILGTVCMDQFVADVTDIPDVQIGEPVLLMGQDQQGTIPPEALAAAANSINYEQVCDVGMRVTRVYRQNGQIVRQENYLLDR